LSSLICLNARYSSIRLQNDRNWNLNNITFLFSGEGYYIFCKLTNGSFVQVSTNDSSIPWKENIKPSRKIKDLFLSNLNIIISGDIIGALYSRGTISSRNVMLFSNGYLYRLFVTDVVPELNDKFAVKVSDLNVKGGFAMNSVDFYYFVVGNRVAIYMSEQQQISEVSINSD
jgi:hypothetical protein